MRFCNFFRLGSLISWPADKAVAIASKIDYGTIFDHIQKRCDEAVEVCFREWNDAVSAYMV